MSNALVMANQQLIRNLLDEIEVLSRKAILVLELRSIFNHLSRGLMTNQIITRFERCLDMLELIGVEAHELFTLCCIVYEQIMGEIETDTESDSGFGSE